MKTEDASENKVGRVNRREFIQGAGLLGASLAAGGLGVQEAAAQVPAPKKKFTEWGWPLPYERVSAKSVKWLKDKGWWPLVWAYQPAWMSQHTVPAVMEALELDKKRGLEVQFRSFLSGPVINEGLIAGKIHLGSGACGPVLTLIDKKVPVKSIGVMWAGVHEQSMMVPLDSTIKVPGDIKGKTIGLVVGSSADMALRALCQTEGIKYRVDFTIKPMTIPEQILLPRGIDMVIPWSAHPRLMWKYRKNARLFNDTADYFLCWCEQHARNELFEAVPDVVQALCDAATEAMLWARLHPAEATTTVKKDPGVDGYPWTLVYEENLIMVNNLKPTWIFPTVEAFAPESGRVAKWMHEDGRTKALVTDEDFARFLSAGAPFMKATFKKLGWKVPVTPPSFPPEITISKFSEIVKKAEKRDWIIVPWRLQFPQPWPEPHDLVEPWYYAGHWYFPKKA